MDGVLTPSCAAPRQPEALADIARDASIADALAAARELLGIERAYLAEAGEPAAEGTLPYPSGCATAPSTARSAASRARPRRS